jgi:hypothetical protein
MDNTNMKDVIESLLFLTLLTLTLWVTLILI